MVENTTAVENKKVSVQVPNQFFKFLDKSLEHQDESRANFDRAIAVARGAEISDPIIADLIRHYFKNKKNRMTLWKWMSESLELPKMEESYSQSVNQFTDTTEESSISEPGSSPESVEDQIQKAADGPVTVIARDEGAEAEAQFRKDTSSSLASDDMNIAPEFRVAVFDPDKTTDEVKRQISKVKGWGWKVIGITMRHIS